MSSFLLVIAILLTGTVIGFVGLAAVSTVGGQYFAVALLGAIATYWVARAARDRVM
jgi:hypothetical protein